MAPKKSLGTFQFVNAWPSSESERLKTESLVRGHIGQWNSSRAIEYGESSDRLVHNTGVDEPEDEQSFPTKSASATRPTSDGYRSMKYLPLAPSTCHTGWRSEMNATHPSQHGHMDDAYYLQVLNQRTAQLYIDRLGAKHDPFSNLLSTLPRYTSIIQSSQQYC